MIDAEKADEYLEYVLELNVVMVIKCFHGYGDGDFKPLKRTWHRVSAIGGTFLHDHVENGCFRVAHSHLTFIHCIFT